MLSDDQLLRYPLEKIARAQVEANLFDEALATVQRVKGDSARALIAEIARAQAEAGMTAEAVATALSTPDGASRARALAEIAGVLTE